MSILDDTLADHGLASWLEGTCICGEDDFTTEHLAAVVWEFTSGPPSQTEIRRTANREYMRARAARMRVDLQPQTSPAPAPSSSNSTPSRSNSGARRTRSGSDRSQIAPTT